MNATKRLFTIILALALLITGISAFADGGWVVKTTTKSMMNDRQARQALKNATEGYAGYQLKPLALLGTQLVAGTNYCILCVGSPVVQKPTQSLCKVYVYENLQGQAKITGIQKIKLRGAPCSGWKISKSKAALVVDRKAKCALKKATEGMSGAVYTPLLTLGKAKDAYSLLCRYTLSDQSATKGLCIVALQKKGGKFVLRRVDDLNVAN